MSTPHPSESGSGNRAAWVCKQRPWLAAHIVVVVVIRLFTCVCVMEESDRRYLVFYILEERDRTRRKGGDKERKREIESVKER